MVKGEQSGVARRRGCLWDFYVLAWALTVFSRMISTIHTREPLDAGEVKLGPATALDFTARYLDADIDLPVRDIDIVTLGSEWSEEGAHRTAFGAFAPEPFDRPRRNLAVYLQNFLQPFEGFSLVAGWRFDDDSRFGAEHHYRVSAIASNT
jgi:outer membrane receptor for ferrienterochelin and colicin